MAMEREFCDLSGDNFENCENCSYEEQFAIFWQVAEMAFAHLKLNFNVILSYLKEKYTTFIL